MAHYYFLIIAGICMAACQPNAPVKDNSPYISPHTSNPGLTPLEKPSLEDDFYEAPRSP